jgi:hypothetical protein
VPWQGAVSGAITAIAVDATHAYWAEFDPPTGTSLRRRALADGGIETLVPAQDGGFAFGEIALANDAVYARGYARVDAVSHDAGAFVATSVGGNGCLASENGGFVESERDLSRVVRYSGLGGSGVPVATGQAGVDEIASTRNGSLLFWLLHGPPDSLASDDRGAIRTVALNASGVGLVADDTAAYWGEDGGSVWAIDRDATTPRMLANRPEEPFIYKASATGVSPGVLALDGTYVYWLARAPDSVMSFATNTLVRANRCNGELSIVARGIDQSLAGLAVGAQHVYWSSKDTIWRVEK